ncbi:hypothetical protein Goshw_029508, partial [Gossypium schwendimanii]|nr:hypothetical protein [Gossypium schwendimanii]
MWSYKSANGRVRKNSRTECYKSPFGSVSGARDRYKACKFDCGADTFGKGGLCIGLRGKISDAETVETRDLSKFISKEAEGLWAIRSQCDGSRGKGFKRGNNPSARQVGRKPRQRESSKVNQVGAIRKSQRGRCENRW